MVSFIGSLIALIVGYMVYGKIVDNIFGSDETRETPAHAKEDGVDYMPLSWPRVFLIQLLNIAGLGPIFGAIAGALFGPAAFLWIVFGSIFAGAVHDYLSGMISVRHDGASIAEIVGEYLGEGARKFMRVFSIILLVLVGTVFMTGPAGLLANMTSLNLNMWLGIIIIYYFLATVLPVDKVIAKLYPILGGSLLVMALGIAGGLVFGDYKIPEIALTNLHPDSLPMWPMLFVTIACGAISGFHATQSPLMARCLDQERTDGRKVFYGAMIAEGVIALIWAAAAMTFFGGTEGLATAMAENGGPAGIVKIISDNMLGAFGGILAMLGVVALPISSGDTAFRSARLTLADIFDLDQTETTNRFKLAIPLFAIGVVLSQMDFSIIWRYFAWSNQTLAMVALWAGAAYLAKHGRFHWIATLPATFMTAVSISYIIMAPEGFGIQGPLATIVGVLVAIGAFVWFLRTHQKQEIRGEMENAA
ncbi:MULTISPECIES: carbon starvation CstA family protein [unclassified Candidatus Frackibacter]|uniref:carbon starvation CstA family protein n=1 Tax=unclassified Candidatus Frackibacter TaxID=2648818 RepID=UPI00088293FF|nr:MULTISPECIES: carbon starvation protein A [unclassified Candidatus Frackibacter]SDC52251.1 Carbon starvation protein CstA [Candidatus Frackibacter sp. WG11]SEM41437.1 Carbon starvation protein CstA [Candidatus Frackibacter sp. WG12]SFL76121.1 Carbon starvation protein CstA [Candidatus Frackibacter sp. WG13]